MTDFTITVNGENYVTDADTEEQAQAKVNAYILRGFKDERSGLGTALLSGLTNDEGLKMLWLAQRRGISGKIQKKTIISMEIMTLLT